MLIDDTINMTEEEILNNNKLSDKEKVDLLKSINKVKNSNKSTMESYGFNSDDIILNEG